MDHKKSASGVASQGRRLTCIPAFLTLTCLFCSGDLPSYPTIADGGIDLSHFDFKRHGPVELSGPYDFFWKRFVVDNDRADGVLPVPGAWNDFRADGKPIGAIGYGTLRLKIRLPNRSSLNEPDSAFGLRFNRLLSATRIYVANEGMVRLVADLGEVGESPGGRPLVKPVLVPVVGGPNIELILHIANYSMGAGGVQGKIELGLHRQLAARSEQNMLIQAMISACFLLFGVYHLTLSDVARIANERTDLQEILQPIAEFLEPRLGMNSYWLLLPDPKGLNLQTHAYVGPPLEDGCEARNIMSAPIPLRPETGAIFLTFSSGRALYMWDLEKLRAQMTDYDKYVTAAFSIRSSAQLPLVVAGQTIGLLLAGAQVPVRLTRSQVHALLSMAAQIAGAVHHSFLLQAIAVEKANVEASRSYIEELNAFSIKVSQQSSLDEVMDYVFGHFRERFKIQTGILAIRDRMTGDYLPYRVEHAPHISDKGRAVLARLLFNEDNSWLTRWLIKSKRAIFLRRYDIKKGGSVDKELATVVGFASVLGVPLVVLNEVVGLLFLTDFRARMHLKQAEVRLISAFSDQVSGAINGALLLELATTARAEAEKERARSEGLLLNILPATAAQELKASGKVQPLHYESVSILFADFVGFTRAAAQMSPAELVFELNEIFTDFDEISARLGIEKIKTIGDAYMAAGGLPQVNRTHPVDVCLAGLHIREAMQKRRNEAGRAGRKFFWDVRIGAHTGPTMAGVVGRSKFSYDIFGDSVNIASRCESSGVPGRINISEDMFLAVKDFFACEDRGPIELKNRGLMRMYFLNRLHPELSADAEGLIPNERFGEMLQVLSAGAPGPTSTADA